jgi:DNA-binding MarR family transcriptional regulator
MENNISILNFAAQKVPDFKEQRGKDWIMFGTEGQWKNRYPEYLLDLYRRSAKNHAIINSKKDYVVGQGWAVKDENLSTFRLAELQQFIKHPNQYESLDDILEKVAMDYELYNGFALEIVYNQLNDKIAAIYHADFARYRSNEDGSCYYYSEDWSKHNPVVEKIDAFNWKEPQGKQLLYVKGYSPDCKYYPLPTYLGSTAYIELDVEVANFHLNSIHNGFMGGTLINFYNGEPTPEEQEEIERQIKDKFTNTDNANSIVLNFSDSRDRGAEIQQLNGNDFDKRFDILNRTVQKEIYAGHQVVDPALFGIKEDGLFTSRTQLIDSFELFQNTYVNNRQQFIERVFNELAALQGLDGCLYIKDTEPISVQFSESTVVSVMTNDEIREKVGLEVIEKEDAGEDGKAKDAQAALKGSVGGVSGIITLLQNVKQGLVEAGSAIQVLTELYGFTPEMARATVSGEEIPEPVAAQMRSDVCSHAFEEEREQYLEQLLKAGSDDYEVTSEGRSFNFADYQTKEEAKIREAEVLKYWFSELGPVESAILEILEKEPSTPFLAIARILNLSIERVMQSLQTLSAANAILIDIDDVLDASQRVVKVTPQGKKIIKDVKPMEEVFELRYVYGLRDNAGTELVIPTTRTFCKELCKETAGVDKSTERKEEGQLGGSKTWSLEQIISMGVKEDRNVWQRGGGWWGKSYHCRHEWKQVVVKAKR